MKSLKTTVLILHHTCITSHNCCYRSLAQKLLFTKSHHLSILQMMKTPAARTCCRTVHSKEIISFMASTSVAQTSSPLQILAFHFDVASAEHLSIACLILSNWAICHKYNYFPSIRRVALALLATDVLSLSWCPDLSGWIQWKNEEGESRAGAALVLSCRAWRSHAAGAMGRCPPLSPALGHSASCERFLQLMPWSRHDCGLFSLERNEWSIWLDHARVEFF